MISIIICSRTGTISKKLKHNINESIGCEYELVIIDNSHHDFDIFSAYNRGIEQAKGDILCFMHEDVYFHSEQWGNIVEKAFLSNTNLGLLGVAGGHVQTCVTDWRVDSNYVSLHFIQRATTLEISPRYNTHTCYHICRNAMYYDKDKTLVKVAAIDGVWFCIPRSLFKYIHFDEITYKGFHIYDLDISMQVIQIGKAVAICNNIEIEHFSFGLYSHDFMKALQLFQKKYESILPVTEGITISLQEKEKIQSYTSTVRLQKRIERDELRKTIMAKQQAIRNGKKGIFLTTEEDMEVRRTVYRYMRYVIKEKENYNLTTAFSSLTEYISDKLNPYKYKVIYKFIYYRLLKFWNV